ncbi:MAG: queuosine 5'-phosphate N-glycosylase/hydrolase [Rudaea sp.]
MAQSRLVSIDTRRIQTVARLLAMREVPVPEWNYEYHFFDRTERSVMYVFLLDALNFSFWGEPRWRIRYGDAELDGYWALAAALKRAALESPQILEADHLAVISPAELARALRGKGEVPLFVERWRNAQELGRVLRDRFDGSAVRMVEAADYDAPVLARHLSENLASFHDASIYGGHEVRFFKRAQILAADLWGSFGGEGFGALRNLGELTCFADYKLPQILRSWGILKYAPALARRVDRKELLDKDGLAEIEIRSSTVWGVELLRDRLARLGRVLTSLQMDWFLWESSQHLDSKVKPYHRVRTVYY